ncbi:hypothetical protein U91I_00759 [alpha proteobacterium U9-1i]|nr:hypothetical protein U91I_00759 [alpha proteobacterium U9-1i]
MKTILLACGLALALAGSAFAQGAAPVQINPQVRAQVNAPRLQPTPRQLELLRAAGAPTERPSLRAATTLSVRSPVTEHAWLEFNRAILVSPAGGATGRAQLEGQYNNPGYVQIAFRADATSRYIVDCQILGPHQNDFKFIREIRNGGTLRNEETLSAVSNERVGLVLQPLGAAGVQQIRLQGNGRSSTSWQFFACEITPVG